jgi:hypothetical protein
MMCNVEQRVSAGAASALSKARLSNYRRFFGANDDRAALGIYRWNDAISANVSSVLAYCEIALRNQFHTVLSSHYGEGAAGSRNWYEFLVLNRKSQEAIRKITHETRRIGGIRQLVRRVPGPSPDDVISKLTFGFWQHVLDVCVDCSARIVEWPAILVDVLPGHRNASVSFWDKQKHRDMLFARIDFCKELRNRIAHLEPVWKAGRLMTERRPRAGSPLATVEPAPSTPAEALRRLQLAYDRSLELLGWLSPALREAFVAGEAHRRFAALNRLSTIACYMQHGAYRPASAMSIMRIEHSIA